MNKHSHPLTVIALFTAVAGQAEALRMAQEKLVAETVKEPGCLRYELNQSLDDPGVLIFTETWASEQAWKDHMQGQAIKQFEASGARNLVSHLTLHRMTLVSDGR